MPAPDLATIAVEICPGDPLDLGIAGPLRCYGIGASKPTSRARAAKGTPTRIPAFGSLEPTRQAGMPKPSPLRIGCPSANSLGSGRSRATNRSDRTGSCRSAAHVLTRPTLRPVVRPVPPALRRNLLPVRAIREDVMDSRIGRIDRVVRVRRDRHRLPLPVGLPQSSSHVECAVKSAHSVPRGPLAQVQPRRF